MSTPSPPPGFVLRDPQGSLSRRISLAMILIVAFVLILGVFIGFGRALLAGVIVGGLALLIGKDSVRAALDWHGPHLQVAAGAYPLGSSPVVTYRRRSKRPTDIASFAVACELVCTEEVTYTRGTDTSTESRKVFQQACSGTGHGTADGLVAEIRLPITAHAGAPTMRLPNNTISWLVTIEVNGPRLPRDSHKFAINVGPKLDASYRIGPQDS